MICKDISLASPLENILYDDVLLHLAENEGGIECLRFWESQKIFVVLGRISKEDEDLKRENILKDKIPVLRRSSGGGTVLQGPGCLNYTLVLSKERSPELNGIHSSYKFILTQIVQALRTIEINAQYFPISDIALVPTMKKFSGNAQKRSKKFILHHGTILCDFHLADIERYLKIPQSMPEYRAKRKHLDFVANIGRPVSEVKQAIREAFGVPRAGDQITPKEKDLLREFVMREPKRPLTGQGRII